MLEIDFQEGVIDALKFSDEPVDYFFCRYLRFIERLNLFDDMVYYRARKFVLSDALTLIREAYDLRFKKMIRSHFSSYFLQYSFNYSLYFCRMQHNPEHLVDIGKEACLGCDVQGFKV